MALTDENMVIPVTPMYGGGFGGGYGGFGGGDDGYTGSELSKTIQEKGLANVLPALDELLDAVQVYNPKLYKSFLRKL